MPDPTRVATDEAGRPAATASPPTGERRSLGERVMRRLDTDATAIAILVALVLLAFSPWWAGGRLFAPLDIVHELYEPWSAGDSQVRVHNHFTSDAVTQYLVYRRFAERSFAEDGFVGWSDLTFGGRPEHANTMAAYDDWTMQLHRFLGFWTAWHLGLMGQFLIAALGMFGFLRSRRCSPLTALLGAVAFAASSLLVLRIYHRWHLAGFAWVPWMAWAMHVASGRRARAGSGDSGRARPSPHDPGRAWAWGLVPVFVALSLLGGSLQTNAFTALAVGSIWLGWMLRDAGGRRKAVTAHVAVWSVLGVGLAAFSLLPEVVAYARSLTVGPGRGGIGYEDGLIQPILSAVFIPLQLVPSLLGSPRSLDLAKALGGDLVDVAYFGFLPGIIAFRASSHRAAPPAAKCLIACGLLLPLTPLVGPLYHRVQIVFIFGGVWAFAWYWQHADRRAVDPVLRRIFAVFIVLVGAWFLASLATVAFEGALTRTLESEIGRRIARGDAGAFGGVAPEWTLARARRLLSELRVWHPRQLAAAAAALGGFAALRLRVRRGVRPASVVLLAAIVFELGVFAASWVSVVDPTEHPPYPEQRDLTVVQERVGRGGRVLVAHGEDRRLTFLPANTLAMYGIAVIRGYESVVAPGIWQAVDPVTDVDLAGVTAAGVDVRASAGGAGAGPLSGGGGADPPTDAAVLGRAGVSHAVSPPDGRLPDGWTPVYRGDRLTLWRNERALPRYVALRPVADGTMGSVWSGLPANGPRASRFAGAVTVEAATANRRVVRVPDGTVAVRVAESWADGWRFRVADGPWRPVRRAADRSMLIPIDPGAASTRVEMSYRSPWRATGWRITIAALVATLAATGGLLARRSERSRLLRGDRPRG